MNIRISLMDGAAEATYSVTPSRLTPPAYITVPESWSRERVAEIAGRTLGMAILPEHLDRL